MKIGQRAAVQAISLDARGRKTKIDLYGEYKGKVKNLHAVKPEGTTIVYGTEVYSEWYPITEKMPPIGKPVEAMICDSDGKRPLGVLVCFMGTFKPIWMDESKENLAEVTPTHWRIREQ